MNESKKIKLKGGAQKVREKNARLLKESAKNCASLKTLFSQDTDASSSSSKCCDFESSFPLSNADDSETNRKSVEVSRESNDTPTCSELNYFCKPSKENEQIYFDYHPIQPKSIDDFKDTNNLFYKDNTNRRWLTYSHSKKSLYCSICLVYAKDPSPFTNGVSDLNKKHIYSRIKEHEESSYHERSVEEFLMLDVSNDDVLRLFSPNKQKHNSKVQNRRQVLERVIEVLKLIGRGGMSYRGKSYENAGSLSKPGVYRGNFLEILLTIAKFDTILKDHLTDIENVAVKSKREKIKKGRGSRVTLISKTTLNYLLDIMHSLIIESIVAEVEKAKMFSVMLDTSQDITVDDQCAIVVRYVTDQVYERIIGLKVCHVTTGKSMYETLRKCLIDEGLDMGNVVGCSTDGAANMRGQYNGFVAYLTAASPEQVKVWCSAHVLNLVILDTTKSTVESNIFSDLNTCATTIKESHKRMDIWKAEVGDSRRMGNIGETRWWSKHNALGKIFGKYGDYSESLYVCLIITLEKIEELTESDDQKRKIRSIKKRLLKFKYVLSAHVFLRIFEKTTPLSKYLQTKGLDLFKCYQMVMNTIESLENVSRDFADVKSKSSSFAVLSNEELEKRNAVDTDFVELELPALKTRSQMLNDGVVHDQERLYEVNTHNVVMDSVISSLKSRFAEHGNLFADLSCFDPNNFSCIKTLPVTAFEDISKKVLKFNSYATPSSIRYELLDFSSKWNKLKQSLSESYEVLYAVSSDSEEQSCDEDYENEIIKSCKECPICCYFILKKYRLYANAYNSIFTCYQYILTLPITQVTCERCFSKLKFIKNRLRNALSQERLETFMIMSIERDIVEKISNGCIIDKLAEKSNLLHSILTYI